MNIEIRDVSKRFDDKIVLNHFSQSIPSGSITCLMGPSGCGKTTLIRILSGLETADEGQITGIDKKNIAFVFQEDRLIGHLSALENCILPLKGPNAKRDGEWALTRLGLENDIHTPARDLSGGMARRVAIARAMIAPAETIFLDEAFKGLDEATKEKAIRFVKDCASGKTIISVTHEASEAELLHANIIKMNTYQAGKADAEGK